LSDRPCGAVVIARDEEETIGDCLRSLRQQTSKLFLAVVNDGSADKTSEIASRYADDVVDLPRHEENWTGQPNLAKVINAGFHVLRKEHVAFALISGADALYPPKYVEEIIWRMKSEDVVLASGIAEGESFRSLSPRGSGRIIDTKWFGKIGFGYPENYGFEVYVVYKALSQGRKVAIYPDLKFKLSRGTKLSKRKMYLWGKGMKALDYWWPYALGRIAVMGLRQPPNAFEMLRGYVSEVSKYDDIKGFVPKLQVRMLWSRAKEIVSCAQP